MATSLVKLPALSGLKKAVIKDVKAAGTNGGTATNGAWRTRTLNTLEGDSDIVSLSSNRFTLQPGSYLIMGQCPASDVIASKCMLYNITTSSNASIGTSTTTTTGGVGEIFITYFSYKIDLTAATTYEVRHRVGATKADTGFGYPANLGDEEVYTAVTIIRLREA